MAHYPSYPPLHDDRTLRSLRRLVLIIAALLATACANPRPQDPDEALPAAGNPAAFHSPLLTHQ